MSQSGLSLQARLSSLKNEPIYVETISHAMVTFVLIFPEHRQESLPLVQRFQRAIRAVSRRNPCLAAPGYVLFTRMRQISHL